MWKNVENGNGRQSDEKPPKLSQGIHPQSG